MNHAASCGFLHQTVPRSCLQLGFPQLTQDLRFGFQATIEYTPNRLRWSRFSRNLEEPPPRKGFFEHDEYEALLRELPNHLRPVLRFAYFTGMRRGEIVGMKWSQARSR